MMKRAVCTLLLCFFAVCFAIAKNKAEHDDDLHEVLFGKNFERHSLKDDKIKKLDAACYLLLDYCKSEKTTAQGNNALRELGSNIKLEQIETPGGRDHEQYTHLGWDEEWYKHAEWYKKDPVEGEKYLQAFKIRRDDIMLKSVQTKIFNDASITWREAELFAKLCYYVHIVGDHENNTPTTANGLMMLIQRPYEKKQTTVIDELISICTELFLFQEDTYLLVGKLRSVRDNTRTLGDTSESGKELLKEVAKIVLGVLKQNVPNLLRDWEPFVENFYEKDYYQDQEDLLAS